MPQNSPVSRFWDFVGKPASARPLAALRIGVSAVLLLQAFWMAKDLLELYGRQSIVQGELSDYLETMALPSLNWLQKTLAPFGVPMILVERLTFAAYVCGLTALLIGLQTRAAAVLTWVTHFALIISGYVFNYGVDFFGNIFLFFMIFMPVGQEFSVDRRLGHVDGVPSPTNRLSLRVLQFEACVIYFSSGLHKAAGAQWWNGEAIWRSLTLPMLGFFDMTWMAKVPWLAMLLCWGTLAIEIGYAFLVWPKKTRRLMVLLTLSLHLAIAIFLGLVSFSLMMMVLTVAAFGVSAEADRSVPQKFLFL